jgi:flavin-dependent dehydrogenase
VTRVEHVPVVVVGGGPAGASAALELVGRGIETVLVEKGDGSGSPVGECLAPSANPLLQRLGLDDILRTSGALPSHGIQSSWGGDGSLADRLFLREPFGQGWHLDRPAFNRALLDAAESAGVPVWRQHRVISLERATGAWRVGTASPEGESVLQAGMLIDASGRRALVARRERTRRSFDSQVAAVGFSDAGGLSAPLHDATTTIEAAADGWWYAALLPNGRLAVAWFTDPDLLAASGAWHPAGWWDLLHASDLIRRLVIAHGYGMPSRISVSAAGSSLLTQPSGDGWIAAGDAAAAHDPLSSHGIGSALAGGWQAAQAVAAALGGDGTAFTAYRERILAGYARYLWTRDSYYADERRWPGRQFWSRRHRTPLQKVS